MNTLLDGLVMVMYSAITKIVFNMVWSPFVIWGGGKNME